MKRTTLLLLLGLACQICLAQGPKIIEKKNKFGLEVNGKKIVKPIYESIKPLSNNCYAIEDMHLFGLMDNRGTVLIPPSYDNIQDFNHELYLVKKDGKCGIVDQRNQSILSVKYTDFAKLNDSQYLIKNGKLEGVVNNYGAIIVPALFDNITLRPQDGSFLIETSNNVGLLSSTGKVIIAPSYQSFKKSASGNYYELFRNGKQGLAGLDGTVIIQPEFDEIDTSSPDFTLVKRDNKIGFIVKDNYIPAVYDRIVFYQQEFGIIAVKIANKFGFISTKTGKVVSPIYDHLTRFGGNGVAFVEKKGRLMNVDISGKEISL